jgi:polyisoprenoid-binding protein YceI
MSVETTSQATGTWIVDKVHSSVRYEIEHNGTAAYRGSFENVDGKLEYGAGGVTLTGVVDLASNDLKDEQQRGHVLSPDFFDAERHPQAIYKSSEITLNGSDVTITGELTLKGVTREVIVTGTIGAPGPNLGGTETIPVNLQATIDRTDWGVSWNAELPNGSSVLGDEVKIEVALELVQG